MTTRAAGKCLQLGHQINPGDNHQSVSRTFKVTYPGTECHENKERFLRKHDRAVNISDRGDSKLEKRAQKNIKQVKKSQEQT